MNHLWQLSDAVILRSESFGGMAFHRRRGITLELDGEAYQFLCACRIPTPLPPADHPAARLIPQLVRLGFMHPLEEMPGPVEIAAWLSDVPVQSPIAPALTTLSAPQVVHLAITACCDRRCAGCYVPRAWGDELPSDAWRSLIDQWACMRVLQLAVGGGEPLCYDGLFDVLAYAATRGLVVNLTTNGARLDARAVDRLVQAGVTQVNISWNSPVGAATDVHPDAERALRLLFDSSLRVGVNLLVTPALLAHLPRVFARLLALGVRQVTVLRPKPPALPGIDAAWYAANRLRRVDLIELRRALTVWQGALKLHLDSALVGLMGDAPLARLRQRGVYGCAPGRRICTVWPDGQVTPCSFLGDLVAGNARQMPFAELWARGEGWERLRDPARLPGGGCAGCAIAAQCGGARCIARCEQGDLDSGDDACRSS